MGHHLLWTRVPGESKAEHKYKTPHHGDHIWIQACKLCTNQTVLDSRREKINGKSFCFMTTFVHIGGLNGPVICEDNWTKC